MVSRAVKVIPLLCIIVFIFVKWNDLIKFIYTGSWAITLPWLLAMFIAFGFIHIAKSFRFYLILSEAKISFRSYMNLYLQTTLVNVIIPFKLGEIYRFYVVGRRLGNYRVSLLSIISERFFDTLVIIVIMLSGVIFVYPSITISFLVFFTFVFFLFSIYFLYPALSSFMNRFIVLKRAKVYDISALKIIDEIDSWYSYEKDLVLNKGMLILFSSAFAWLSEYVFLYSLAKGFGLQFDFSVFSLYINDILLSPASLPKVFFDIYAVVYVFVISIAYISIIVCRFLLGRKVK